MPSDEAQLTIKELHCKETAGHLGTDKTIEEIKSRSVWVNLSRDAKKFIRECYDCQKVKPPNQGTKVGTNPKLRPRWKGAYLVSDMFNEVNAILKADGRSRKTKIVHLCKLKRCFGKPQVVAINNEEQSVNENSQISNSLDPMSPAPNRKREEGRTACPNANANANANASNNELTVGQPQDLVPDIEEDDYTMTVDSQNNGSPVHKLLSKQHQSNKENVLPSTSRTTRSTQSPVNRQHYQT